MGDPAAGAGSQCDPTQLGSLITPTAERRQLPSPWQERRVLVGATVDLEKSLEEQKPGGRACRESN